MKGDTTEFCPSDLLRKFVHQQCFSILNTQVDTTVCGCSEEEVRMIHWIQNWFCPMLSILPRILGIAVLQNSNVFVWRDDAVNKETDVNLDLTARVEVRVSLKTA